MNEQSIDYYLRSLTPEEKEHLEGTCTDYSVMTVAGHEHGQPYYRFEYDPDTFKITAAQKNMFMEYYNFSVIKQDRFEAVPLHVHDWLELNYVYSGSCALYVNGTNITLSQGQMTLINTAAPHAVSRCEENDILINFLMSKEYLNAAFFERIGKDNYLSNFFIEALNSQTDHNNYLVFAPQKNNRLETFANQFLCEYYAPSVASSHMLDSLMTLIMCELINVFEHSLTTSETGKNMIYPILRYIEKNFQHCTLESTAEFFHMHPNYLSAYIKKRTGISFKKMIQTQRLQQAAQLLKNTSISTNNISYHVGYANTSFFFQKFKETYGCTPKEYRKKHQLFSQE